ncbi:hypothetical protein BGX38DRAFT_487880 [Terfezia claveryi]|nr:hypothetical protein BGX38DRAFT_487880 [Terfezia claveryi]
MHRLLTYICGSGWSLVTQRLTCKHSIRHSCWFCRICVCLDCADALFSPCWEGEKITTTTAWQVSGIWPRTYVLRLICRECFILGTRKHGLVSSVPSSRYLHQPDLFYDISSDFCLPHNYLTNEQRYWCDSDGRRGSNSNLMDPHYQSELQRDWQQRVYRNSRVGLTRRTLPPASTSFRLQLEGSNRFIRHFLEQWEMRKLVIAFRGLNLGCRKRSGLDK